MSVREREWLTASGRRRRAWIADFKDHAGQRRLKTFKRRAEAQAWQATMQPDKLVGMARAAQKLRQVAVLLNGIADYFERQEKR